MSTNKNWEFHKYCLIFPQATDAILHDMANDIATHGLSEEIVTYEGKILDGRNRFLACGIAGVEPIFTEYDGDDPFQYVITKNHQRRHLNESQRAMVGRKIYDMAKENDLPKITLDQISKKLGIGERTLRMAGTVMENASEAAQKAVEDGATRLNSVAKAVQQAKKETGITKPVTPEEKKVVQEAVDKHMSVQPVSRPPDKAPKTPEQAFHDRFMNGEFNGRRWQKNIAEMQACIATIERIPKLYHDCFELLKALDDENILDTICAALIEAVRKVEQKLHRMVKPDFSEIKKIIADLAIDKFQIPDEIPDDRGADDKRELLEHLRDQLVADCREYVKEAEKVRRKLGRLPGKPQHSETEQADTTNAIDTKENDDSTPDTSDDGDEKLVIDGKVIPSEFAKYIRGILANDQSKRVISFEEDIVPHYNGDRVQATAFLAEFGFEEADGKLRIANTENGISDT